MYRLKYSFFNYIAYIVLHSDYRPMPALDRYDPAMLDDDDYSELSQGERVAAEIEMRKRDRAAGIIRDDKDLLYGKFTSISLHYL